MKNRSDIVVTIILVIFFIFVSILTLSTFGSSSNGDAAGKAIESGLMVLFNLFFTLAYGVIMLFIFIKHYKTLSNIALKALVFVPLIYTVMVFLYYFF